MSSMTIPERFARNLKSIRQRQGYTQSVMATSLDVSRSSYSGYENGAAEPGLALLHAIQQRYGIGVDLLLNADLHLLGEWQWRQMLPNAGGRTVETTKREG